MKILIGLTLLFLAGCSPGQIHANHNGGGYECYPAPDKCAYAFGPLGDLKVGQKLYFKQVDAYGKVGQVITARPCKEGE